MKLKDRLMYVLAGRKIPRSNALVKYRLPQKTNNFRDYAAGIIDRLTTNFKGSSLSINESLKISLTKMRHRSRELVNDNDYGKKFISMVKTNVIGPNGIKLQARALGSDGLPDKVDNDAIEMAWKDFCKMENCTVAGNLTMNDVDRIGIGTVATDGEVFIRIVYGSRYKYGFALYLIDPDKLDTNLNQDKFGRSNRVIMSVELDEFDVPVAYFVLTRHPSETNYYGGATLTQISGGGYAYGGKHYMRIPANEIIHLFLPEKVQQCRGIPWMHTSIKRLNMIGGYEEAELVAARVGASTIGTISTETGEEYKGDGMEADGTILQDLEPGSIHQLPKDQTFTLHDPTHPTGSYNYALKGFLRGASAGLDVAYNNFAGDMEGVSFSSIRSGTIEERENWKMKQNWWVEHCKDAVYKVFLRNALLRGLIVNDKGVTLPISRTEKFMNIKWQPRGFAWVDPKKDQETNDLAIAAGHTTNSNVVAQVGLDLEDVYEQLAYERDLAIKYGLDFSKKEVVKEDENKDESEKDDDEKDEKD